MYKIPSLSVHQVSGILYMMSNLTKYYKSNHSVNPYTMEKDAGSSRVALLQYYIKNKTPSKGKILNVGCGDMYLEKVLPEYAWTSLDISHEANDGKAQIQDLEETPYPLQDETFDTVLCSETLEHLFDPVKVTREIYRVLKTGGTYVLSTPNFDFIEHYLSHFREVHFQVNKPWTKEHIHWYTVESHADILGMAGFKGYEYMGADPHIGKFFEEPRSVLYTWLLDVMKCTEQEARQNADALLSNMFRKYNHTVIVVTQK